MGQLLTEEEIKERLISTKLELVGPYINYNTKTLFKCYCGKNFNCIPNNIFKGHSRSCGCYRVKCYMKMPFTDLTNNRYGKLVVRKRDDKCKRGGETMEWICDCDCGNTKVIMGARLQSGNTKSCGCLKYIRGKEHASYNPELTDEQRALWNCRRPEDRSWSNKILKRDKYTCLICCQRGIELKAHHLDGYGWCIKRQLDLTNGVTLCKECHNNFHKIYGTKNNTQEEFIEYRLLMLYKLKVIK